MAATQSSANPQATRSGVEADLSRMLYPNRRDYQTGLSTSYAFCWFALEKSLKMIHDGLASATLPRIDNYPQSYSKFIKDRRIPLPNDPAILAKVKRLDELAALAQLQVVESCNPKILAGRLHPAVYALTSITQEALEIIRPGCPENKLVS